MMKKDTWYFLAFVGTITFLTSITYRPMLIKLLTHLHSVLQ